MAILINGDANNNTLGDTLSGALVGEINVLVGGAGNDTYIVDDAADQVVENVNEGTADTVQASVSYALSDNVENLTLTGTANLSGMGNSLNNTIVGNAGNNVLNGGLGIDIISGGAGNDLYIVDSTTDTITENVNEGTDTIQSSVTFDLSVATKPGLAQVENLILTGTATNGVGNALNNLIIGNNAINILDGKVGNDTLVGGAGNDTYKVDVATDVIIETSTGGVLDVVESTASSYTLSANLEKLVLVSGTTLATTTAITGIGNDSDNTIVGNIANNTLNGGLGNDTIDGGLGVDIFNGGAGDDTYLIDAIAETNITDASGVDTVKSSVNYTLGIGLEKLELTGTALNGTGNADANTIIGNGGSNRLNGGAGTDVLNGGAGNDTYIIDNVGDSIIDASGLDTVEVTLNSYTLTTGLENLVFIGTGNFTGTGNDLANSMTGSIGADSLNGGTGNDTLDGGAGADSLTGGAGNDFYKVDNAGDSVVESTIVNEGIDTVAVSLASYTLGANVENLLFVAQVGVPAINATGNDLANSITGGAGNDVLNGGLGNDTLNGGLGNDSYTVDSSLDVIIDAGGIDTVQSGATYSIASSASVENLTLTGSVAINGTGNGLGNLITGNEAINTLDGGAGNDTLNGGIGNDSLIGGLGNDSLIGGAGNDNLDGSAGSDIYVVDSTSGIDIINDTGVATDKDLIQSGVTFDLTNAATVENLTLTGTTAINGIGNALANVILGNTANNSLNGGSGNDSLDGGAGNDTLEGGAGVDTLLGGAGNDLYIVDTATDLINDIGGIDTVFTSASYALGTTVENLTLNPTAAAINGTGNNFDNTITGNNAANILSGGLGNDVLIGGGSNDVLVGGGGADQFQFTAVAGIDTVSDFATGLDKLVLSRAGFGLAGTGSALVAGDLATVETDVLAEGSTSRLVLSQESGALFYNTNGATAGFGTGGGQFALLAGVSLAATDFTVIA
jgi:Ca2+-binding RTX toxin-like protein